MELWDAYDADFHRIEGKTLIRGEPVPEGIFHLVCDVLVKHTDGTFLLMQRAPGKHFGGMWEATAGGSALAGETPLECASRELREETGMTFPLCGIFMCHRLGKGSRCAAGRRDVRFQVGEPGRASAHA